MAPGQLEGKEADARTDIFALGTVLYEMATGKKAFEGTSRASLMAAILEHPSPLLTVQNPATPAVLDRVVTKCLAKDPDARWQSARDLKDELEWIAGGSALSAVLVARRGNHARVAWAVAGVVAVIAMVVAFLHFREKPTETRAVRFSILPPENTTFDDPLAFSPDGSRLALIVSTPGKGPSLWVRRLDALTAQPLAGTEGASDPFWSPDGQFIAFFAQGRLKKIEVSGGPAQTLCDIGDGERGDWNRDGVIVFTHNDALYRVPAEGGRPSPLSVLNQGTEGAGQYWPQFLPDGHHFLYYQTVVQGNRTDGIYVGSLDSQSWKRLLDNHWMAAYAPALDGGDGYLLFIREGTLMAQRFDANYLQLTGKPVPLAERMTDLDHHAIFSVSASGNLAYRTTGTVKSELTWFDRGGKRLGTAGVPVQDIFPTLSPDGGRLAISRTDPQSGNSRAKLISTTAPSDIWVLELTRGTASRLTFDSASDFPLWSPDGGRIAFVSNRDGSYNLYQKASNGAGTEELLLKSDEYMATNDWSSDGRFLAYASISPKTAIDLWVLPLDGDRKPFPFLQTPFGEGAGKFSPDGHWMAYQSNESGRWEVYVRPFSGAAQDGNNALGGKWLISTEGGTFVHWRSDGKELLYLDPKGKMIAVDVKTGVLRGRPTFEFGVPRPLFDAQPYGFFPYTVTGDGQRFLVTTKVVEEKSPNVNVVLNWPAELRR
jgi:Tol biopolymer transport system component